MTLFVGGPYDGIDLPVDPMRIMQVTLPDPGSENLFTDESDMTLDHGWPHVYRADLAIDPPVFRFERTKHS